MESSILKKAGRFLREQVKNKRWRKVLTVLGAGVVFITAYLLLMPGVSMERKTVCELQEHIHTDECYGQILTCGRVGAGDESEDPVTLEFQCTFPDELHAHTEECYDREHNLICGYADYAVHAHTDGCYEDGHLVCELSENEEHEHTDACWRINDSGYKCGQEESESHTHTDNCYTEHRELICEEEVQEGHTHTADCYTEEWETVCGLEDDPEHVHDETDCYQVTKTCICGEEESSGHAHDSSCYETERELTCGKEENPDGHKHTEACRGVVKELVCGRDEVIVHEHTVENDCYEAVLGSDGKQLQDEDGELLWTLVCDKLEVQEHVHGRDCYLEHAHTEDCYEEGLICGLEEHEHTEACKIGETVFYCAGRIHAHVDKCYDGEEQLVCGYGDIVIHSHDESCQDTEGALICPLPEMKEHTHGEECYNSEGSLVCQLPEVWLHTHVDTCYDKDGNLACGKPEIHEHHHSEDCYRAEVKEEETQEQLYTKSCEGDGYIVTVSYRADANIPEEAELIAEQITQEENEAHYAERQAQFQKALKDEGAAIRALLKIGFYLDGEEIEPESDVTVTVQLLDENGLAEGGPVTVVHFAKDDTEILDGSQVKDSSTTFQMGSFSEIAIGYRTGEEESAGIYVSQVFTYEDDAVQITFHIEGNAQPLDSQEKLPSEENGGDDQAEKPADTEEEGIEAAGTEEDPEEDFLPEVTEDLQGDEKEQTEIQGNEDAGEYDETAAKDNQQEQKEAFVFKVDPVKKNTEEYETFLSYVNQNGGAEELIRMQVLSYSLFYEGVELDLANCQVTAEITTAPALREQVGRSIPEAVSYLRSHEGDAAGSEGTVLGGTEPEKASGQPAETTSEMPEEVEAPSSDGSKREDTEPAEEEKTDPEMPAEDSKDGSGEAEESAEEESAEEKNMQEPSEEPAEDAVEDGSGTDAQAEQTLGNETELILTVMEQSDNVEMNELANIVYEETGAPAGETMEVILNRPMFAVKASNTANPAFTVQYYANLNVLDEEAAPGSEALPVIDTTGGKLPVNQTGLDDAWKMPLKNIYVDGTGKVLKTRMLTEVYKSRPYRYIDAPTLNYFNALIDKPNYRLAEIWVSKVAHTDSCYRIIDEETGEKERICSHEELESIDPEDWDVYRYSKEIHFTNRSVSGSAVPGGDSGYIYIAQDATIRLVYDVTDEQPSVPVTFYDYDISDGRIYGNREDALKRQNGKITDGNQNDNVSWIINTKESGINNPDNYKDYTGSQAKLAFGNANAGTQLGTTQQWKNAGYSNQINRLNGKFDGAPGSYKGCAFGMVTGLDANGHIQYADGINAPKLFNDGDAVGKTSYDNYSLQFARSGDTYTLSAVTKNGGGTVAGGLTDFSHPGIHTNIWTNHFWPMDSVDSWGTDGHDPKSGASSNYPNRNFVQNDKGTSPQDKAMPLPRSDDGKNHNAYFGMAYEVEFELSEDYVGPLEYYFYGDDDLWVFLDGRLICDIGGVHQSVGEYVNLWDYLNKGEPGEHTLNVFYTERGASGSTCWMEFTLPSVTVKGLETTDKDYGRLRVDKKVAGTSNLDGSEVEWDSGDEFEFEIKLTAPDGVTALPDDYSYYKYDKNGNKVGSDLIVWDGGTFTLKNGEYIVIQFLPQGTRYTVTELNGATKYKEKKDESGNTVYDENGEPVLEPDGDSDYYYFTGIVVDGEGQGENLTDDKTASGSIPEAGESNVLYTNRVLIYELPESGGPGTNLYTMAGISLLLMAGLMYRKKFKEGGKSSSEN